MPLLLVLEDNPADLRKAVDFAKRAGFTEFEVSNLAPDAKLYLEKAMSGKVPRPDAMLVELTLGVESGFELIRFWHSRPQLKQIPVVVWTVARGTQLEICRYFGVRHLLSKDDDPNVLREALASIIENSARDAAS
jgi:CheY-like chemotaxis protein